jgi:predicted secreted hydrolase
MTVTRRTKRWLVIAGILATTFVVFLSGFALPTPHAHRHAGISVGGALSAQLDGGYAHVTAPPDFQFPRDHGAHPGFRSEWWYWTGNLGAADGRRWGYQYTLFRVALAPPSGASATRASAWASDQVWFAHLAVTDGGGRFISRQCTVRGALGLAGAEGEPFHVWIDAADRADAPRWEVSGWDPMHLHAACDAFILDFDLHPGPGPVLQGDRGMSRKSAQGASAYYSFPRMPTAGSIACTGETPVAVSGQSWLDREWSTTALAGDQVGWDWFALQLDDGREVMLYRLRRTDGSVDPASSGTLIAGDGGTTALARDAVAVSASGTWTSPRSGAAYPAGWSIDIPGQNLQLSLSPLIADQELDVGFHYWEGAVTITAGGKAVGRGYVELTGYDRATQP